MRGRLSFAASNDRPMRFAYADPPYPGFAKALYHMPEVDHPALIASLLDGRYDGFALSTSAKALRDILPLLPATAHVCPWVKPIGVPSTTHGLHTTWEPLIVVGGRELHAVRDFLIAQPARGGGSLIGRKPSAFCAFLFAALGMRPCDVLDDLFPGTGIVSNSWAHLSSQVPGDADSRPASLTPA